MQFENIDPGHGVFLELERLGLDFCGLCKEFDPNLFEARVEESSYTKEELEQKGGPLGWCWHKQDIVKAETMNDGEDGCKHYKSEKW